MNAKELRLGNYIKYSSSAFGKGDGTVYAIQDDLIVTRDGTAVYPNELEPIPLTEEWLLKFGFVYSKNYDEYRYKEKTNWFGIFKSEYDDWLFEKPNMSSVVLPNVHQLQNLYFALTNTELSE